MRQQPTSTLSNEHAGLSRTLSEYPLAFYIGSSNGNHSNRYAANATTFRYYYAGNFSNIAPRSWEGAYHSSELPLIFGTHDIAHSASTPFEYAVSHGMQDLWLSFMQYPVNGLPGQGWNA